MLVFIGLFGGVSSGMFGVGGGIVIVPALVYLVGFSQHKATGTSLAVLLPPIGLAATFEYYRNGNVDIRAAIILAAAMFVGAWGGAFLANQMKGPHLRLIFGGVRLWCRCVPCLRSMQTPRLVVTFPPEIGPVFWRTSQRRYLNVFIM